MLRVKKGATNKTKGMIKITILNDEEELNTLPTSFDCAEGKFLGYQDTVDGDYLSRIYLFSPSALIDEVSFDHNKKATVLLFSRVNFSWINIKFTSLKRIEFDRIMCENLTSLDNFLRLNEELEYITNLNQFDTSKVKFMRGAFDDLISLKEPLDISNWDTSSCIYFPTFTKYPFDNIDFINNWDMSNNNNTLSGLIAYSKVKSVDLSNTNLKLVDGISMFSYGYELETVNLKNVNMDNCENINEMFMDSNKIKIIDLSMAKKITSAIRAFAGCTELIILDLSHIDLEDADIEGIFDYTPNLQMPKTDYCSYNTKLKIKEAYENRLL